MSASVEMKLSPWLPPNFARVALPPGKRQDGLRELPAIAIADLPIEALNSLAEQWLVALYAKAGKPSPWSRP
jgi:hypothetical protein